MTTTNLADLESRLWAAADELRANSSLSPTEYRGPVLGLIFLAFAEHRFDQLRPELETKATERRPVSAEDLRARGVLFVPDIARLSWLVDLPEGEDLGANVDLAMDAIESTARWDVREARRNPAIEDAVVKTVAAFLNTDGGTLLIGVAPDGSLVGLELDYPQVKPENGDGFVNWLTTHLATALGAAAVMRTRARIVSQAGVELCRLDVAPSSQPTWARTSKEARVFFVRMNNSSRAMPADELSQYLVDRWPDRT